MYFSTWLKDAKTQKQGLASAAFLKG